MSEQLLKLIVRAGEMMLKNGAETYRVEETMEWMAKGLPGWHVEAFVTPTGIFVTLENQNGERLTQVKRVRERTLDLSKVYQVNDCSRRLAAGALTPASAWQALDAIEGEQKGPRFFERILAAGIGGACFTKLLGGNWLDFVVAFAASLLVQALVEMIRRLRMVRFVVDFMGGVIGAAMSALGVILLYQFRTNLNAIIPGAVITLVPGVAITNAVRDMVAGDLISGITRGVEALLAATAIAAGVALSLRVFVMV